MITSIPLGSAPSDIVANPVNGYVYVSRSPMSTTVAVISGTNIVTDMQMNSLVYNMDADPVTGYMYIQAEVGIAQVTGTQIITKIPAGMFANGIGYNHLNGYLYMLGSDGTDFGNAVKIVSGTQVIASLPVDWAAYFVGIDRVGLVYVASQVSDTITILSNTQVVNVLPAGKYASWMAVNPKSGYIYVTNMWSDDIVILDRGHMIGRIPVGAEPSYIAINPTDNLVYVSNFFGQSISILQEPVIIRSLTPRFLSAPDEDFVLEFSEPVITSSIQFAITPSINFTVTWENTSTTRLSISHEPILQGHPVVLQVLPGGEAPSHIPVASPAFDYAIAYQTFLPLIRKNS